MSIFPVLTTNMNRRIRAIQFIYTQLFYMGLPYVLWRHRRKERHVAVAKGRLHERLGKAPILKECIWLHAVSVGEMIAAAPLVNALTERYSDLPILVTCTTGTGSEQAIKLFSNKVAHVFLPYDLPWLIRRFLRRANPRLLIIMETELWPNLLSQCQKAKVPVMLANARLSNKSLQGYKKIMGLTSAMLNRFAVIAAQSQQDAENFLQLGVSKENLLIAGNLKFDLTVSEQVHVQGKALRQAIGPRPLWIAASTHEGEEKILLAAFATVLNQLPNCLLILVPRHPDRFNKVLKLCEQAGYKIASKSQVDAPHESDQIFLVDQMGELLPCYAASDIAFVGGSLLPIGGHNMLEPAAFALPILTGPYLANFLAVSEKLQMAGALQIVNNAQQISAIVLALFADKDSRHRMGAEAKKVLHTNIGALDRHLDWITHNLPSL